MASSGSQTSAARAALGRRGEELAAIHLRRLGFRTLARNHRTRGGEIDLIAYDGLTLAFVEVKTRRVRRARRTPDVAACPATPRHDASAEGLGWPAARQRRRMRGLALAWLSEGRVRPPRAQAIRFDVLRVVVGAGGELLALEHLEGAL